MEEYRVLSTTAILGYGFPMSSFESGMARKPHLIAVDAGRLIPARIIWEQACHLQTAALSSVI